jgi:hypothetical protein
MFPFIPIRLSVVYATSGQACSGDLFIQPGCRAHGFDLLGGYEGCPTAISIHTGFGAIMRPLEGDVTLLIEFLEQVLNECTYRIHPAVHGVQSELGFSGLPLGPESRARMAIQERKDQKPRSRLSQAIAVQLAIASGTAGRSPRLYLSTAAGRGYAGATPPRFLVGHPPGRVQNPPA